MFKLGKYEFVISHSECEEMGGYLMFEVSKQNSSNSGSVYALSLLIHSETYEIEPFFAYIANGDTMFRCIGLEEDATPWYLGEDVQGWTFAIPNANEVYKFKHDIGLNREKALTLVKVMCTIRDNYDEFVDKMDREIVEFQL